MEPDTSQVPLAHTIYDADLGHSVSPAAHAVLGKILVARDSQGELIAVGRCITHCDAPTVTIVTPTGEQVNWRADMCKVVVDQEDIVESLIPSKVAYP